MGWRQVVGERRVLAIKMKGEIRKIWSELKDWLFPKRCLGCGEEGEWLCFSCLKAAREKTRPQFFCPACGTDNQAGLVCVACCDKSFLDRAVAVADYKEAITAKSIQLVKYQYAVEVAEVWKMLIGDFVVARGQVFSVLDTTNTIIVPVPLHRRRFLERGFNQAEILGRWWAKELGFSMITDLLLRKKNTGQQAKLGREARLKNLSGAFTTARRLNGQTVLLIDDVFTTGSTLQECAQTLKLACAKEVWGLTLARER